MYLVSYSDYPFTAADIRRDIGLASTAFDGAIECAIVSAASFPGRSIRTETWAIAAGTKPFGKPSSIGPLTERKYSYAGTNFFRDCTYEPDPKAIQAVRRDVVNWALNQDDIAIAMGAEARRAMNAPVALQAVA